MIFATKNNRIQLIIWTLLLLNPIIGMAVDLISPSLPAIAADLHVSAKIVKNAISIYLLGYALGNFLMGFLTDALGRQKLIRISLAAFVIVSLIPMFFSDINILLLTRFLQGFMLGGVAVLVRAICSDVLPPEKLVNMGTLFVTMWGIGPIIGPLIGGYLQFYLGWKANFGFFSLISLILLIAVFIVVPETHFNRHPFNLKTIKKNMIEIFSHQTFISLVVLMGLNYTILIVFNTVAPFLIQTQFHYSPVFFGHLALVLGFIFLASTFCCRYFLKYFKMEQILLVAINLFFAISILMIFLGYVVSNGVTLIAIASGLMFFGTGFIFPLSMGKGMSLFRHIAGTASATMFLINVLITSVSAFLVSFINMQSVVPLLWIYFILMFICLVVYWKKIHLDVQSTR